MPQKTPKTPGKRKTITFEPPQDIRELLEQAELATGADRTTLIIEAIRTDLAKVVQKIIEQRQRAAEEFFRMSKGDDPSQSIAFPSETTPPYRTKSRSSQKPK
jgi:uncharacterized protein (DUF1778 family)